MADKRHLAILKKGVKTWNQWRKEHPEVEPDLSEIQFAHLGLQKCIYGDERYIDLEGINFSMTNFSNARIIETDLTKANLRHANLNSTDLWGSRMSHANLTYANLTFADLNSADLLDADLSNSNLYGTNLTWTELHRVNMTKAKMRRTILGDVNLSTVVGLETINHEGPSIVGIGTITRSGGHIPEIFLREAGIPQSIIEQIPSLIGSLKPVDYYSCFISYSSKDEDFAKRLYADLQAARIRCWFAPEDLKIGDRFADRIEESIRTYDKLLIILSGNSIRSTWVEDECRAALEKESRFREEQQLDKTVLFPIKLDEAIKEAASQWVCKVRRERHIGDFINWKDHDAYQIAFERLLRDLKA